MSLEPVIEPEETFRLVTRTAGFVDLYRVGKLNYRKPPKPVDWGLFAILIMEQMRYYGSRFHIKDDLKKHVPEFESYRYLGYQLPGILFPPARDPGRFKQEYQNGEDRKAVL